MLLVDADGFADKRRRLMHSLASRNSCLYLALLGLSPSRCRVSRACLIHDNLHFRCWRRSSVPAPLSTITTIGLRSSAPFGASHALVARMPGVPIGGVSSTRRSGLQLHPLSTHLQPVPACYCCGRRQRGLSAGPARHGEPACTRSQPPAQPSLRERSQSRRGARLIARGFGDDLLDFINGPVITALCRFCMA